MTQSLPEQVSYRTVGKNRDVPRLWIEGAKPEFSGFVKGTRYRVEKGDRSLALVPDPLGPLIVSGKERAGQTIPVLDIGIRSLPGSFEAGTRVRVVFRAGKIEVSLHHEDMATDDRENRLRRNYFRGRLVEASMFTGGGISTHAIHSAVADHGKSSSLAWVVDSESKYLQSGYANNYAIDDSTVALVGKAEEIETAFYTPVDVLSFSMPCTGFSVAGRAKHGLSPEEHEGATSLFGVVAAIKSANPAILISENVREARGSTAYSLLISELTRIGYRVFERNMDARDTGSLENRRRYWFVAISEGLADGYSFDNTWQDSPTTKRILSDILDKNVPETAWSDNTYLKEKKIRDEAAGKGFAKRQLLDGSETSIGTIGRNYSKRQSVMPFLVRDDGKERLLTPAEHARAKSVPEELIRDLPMTVAHEILGQSVDWRQAWLVMSSVMGHLSRALGRGHIQRVAAGNHATKEKPIRSRDTAHDTISSQLNLFGT